MDATVALSSPSEEVVTPILDLVLAGLVFASSGAFLFALLDVIGVDDEP